jgi:hypothetical protein
LLGRALHEILIIFNAILPLNRTSLHDFDTVTDSKNSGISRRSLAKCKFKEADKMNNQIIEESTTGYSGHLPEVLPMRPGPPPAAPWRQFMRSFWAFSLSSYSIVHTPDGAARVRHIAMVAILLLRSAMSTLSILFVVIKGSIAGIVI